MSEHYTHPDPAVRELIARHVAEALNEAAVAIEREKHIRPINGDGSNYALARALSRLAAIAGSDAPIRAAASERTRLDEEYEERWLGRSKPSP